VITIRLHRLAARLSSVVLLSFITSLSAAADAPSPGTPAARPRIGLVLSGGGARGAAHIGVLKVLEEHRVPIDCIAGTSMGALVGGLYATGMSAAELERVIAEVDWSRAFADRTSRADRSFRRKRDDDLYLVRSKPGIRRGALLFPPGLIDGQRVDLLLKRHTLPVVTQRDFDRLAIPFRAVAADIETGEGVVLGRGDLALAMRASMAIPAVFAPREIDGRLLVDGGITENLPIEVARAMGADLVIAVDIGTPPARREQLGSVVAITGQLASLMSEPDRLRQLATLTPRDLFIQPDLGTISTASFGRAIEAVPIGAHAAEEVADRLAPLALSPEAYAAYRAPHARRLAPPVIDEVRIVNHSRLADDVLAARLGIATGVPLDVDALETAIDQVVGLELFESVYYDIDRVDGRQVLTVTARERSWGPDYLQAGIAAFEDYEGPDFECALAFSRTALNGRGGEWLTVLQAGRDPGVSTRLHQPLDRQLRGFVDVLLSASDMAVNVFGARGHKDAELEVRRLGLELSGGRELGTWGELRAGVTREGGRIRTQVGTPGPVDRDFAIADAFAQVAVDRLDDLDFPRAGHRLRTRVTAGLRPLGSEREYRQWLAEGAWAASRGHGTAFVSGSLATTLSGDAPLPSRFALGGFTRLSGLQYEERPGPHAAVLSVAAYRRLNEFVLLPVYAGGTLEYGGVFEHRDDIHLADGIAAGSVFLGLDTPLGPVLAAVALAEGGRTNYYLGLGEAFHPRRPGFWRR
jgi:NTE family protein